MEQQVLTDFDFANTFLRVPEAELGALLSPSIITEGIISTLDNKYFLGHQHAYFRKLRKVWICHLYRSLASSSSLLSGSRAWQRAWLRSMSIVSSNEILLACDWLIVRMEACDWSQYSPCFPSRVSAALAVSLPSRRGRLKQRQCTDYDPSHVKREKLSNGLLINLKRFSL